MLIYNAKVWRWHDTVATNSIMRDGFVQHNSFVTIENDLIKEIGSMDRIDDAFEIYESKINAYGKLILPGLIDSHIHVALIGESQYYVNLSNCNSIDDLKNEVLNHLNKEETRNLSWIIGINWDQSQLLRYPTRHDLDEVCSDRPMFLWRACWHIGIANTKALEIVGLDLTKNIEIEGGSIDYDETNQSITGILRERAVELITSSNNNKTFIEKMNFIEKGLNLCLNSGLTCVQTNDEASYLIYKKLCEDNNLNIRVYLTPTYDDLLRRINDSGIRDFDRSTQDEKSLLQIDRIKLFSDGSLGAETAAIRSNGQSADIKGILIHSDDKLNSMIKHIDDLGYRLEIHAIGDAAAEQVINAVEKNNIDPSKRPILTHCQVLGSDLIERMRVNGIIANVQPSFVPTDMKWVQERLTSEHQLFSYAWKSLLNSKVYVAGGSDAPIENHSPFVGLYDAIYRKSRNSYSNEVYRPEECLTFSEALWIYTIGGAFACNNENKLGSISNGYLADLVIVDDSILEDNSLLKSLTPEYVIVNGLVSYGKESIQLSNNLVELKGPYVPGKGGIPIHHISNSHCGCCIKSSFLPLKLRSFK